MRADVKLATLSPRFSLDTIMRTTAATMTAMMKLKTVAICISSFYGWEMDIDGSNPDIAIVVGNNIRIRTEYSGRSNNKVILRFTI